MTIALASNFFLFLIITLWRSDLNIRKAIPTWKMSKRQLTTFVLKGGMEKANSFTQDLTTTNMFTCQIYSEKSFTYPIISYSVCQ